MRARMFQASRLERGRHRFKRLPASATVFQVGAQHVFFPAPASKCSSLMWTRRRQQLLFIYLRFRFLLSACIFLDGSFQHGAGDLDGTSWGCLLLRDAALRDFFYV